MTNSNVGNIVNLLIGIHYREIIVYNLKNEIRGIVSRQKYFAATKLVDERNAEKAKIVADYVRINELLIKLK
tara:strand:+ start:4185 stop:4400 length:216 start_codon:yes stop_codon:yes gene_type:complete